jgi:serine protease Do
VPSARRRLELWLIVAPLCFLSGLGVGRWWADRAAAPSAPAPVADSSLSIRQVVAKSRDAVVGVRCLLHAGSPEGKRDGSGFLFHEGLVLTNAHLVAGHRLMLIVEVTNRGRFEADLVSEDPVSDLAILRLRAAPADLPRLTFGDSSALEQGDWVVTLGRPFDLSSTVTAGLVSHVDRPLSGIGERRSTPYLQFSAAVNPGNSGGPVLDLHGRVVGVTTARHAGAEGLAFAVPSRVVTWVLERMERHHGQVPRGYLGVSLAPGNEADNGARVLDVERDGPAWHAGIRPGDVVLEFAGEPVSSAQDLLERITRALPDAEVSVAVRGQDQYAVRSLVAVLGNLDGNRRGSPTEPTLLGPTDAARRGGEDG